MKLAANVECREGIEFTVAITTKRRPRIPTRHGCDVFLYFMKALSQYVQRVKEEMSSRDESKNGGVG